MAGREGNWPNEGPQVLAELQNLRREVEFNADRLSAQQLTINVLEEKVNTMSQGLADVQAAETATQALVTQLGTAITGLITTQNSQIQSLIAQLAANPSEDPQVEKVAQQMLATNASIQSILDQVTAAATPATPSTPSTPVTPVTPVAPTDPTTPVAPATV